LSKNGNGVVRTIIIGFINYFVKKIPATARTCPTSLDSKLSPPYFFSLRAHKENIL
jgi:hypothetical protein